MIENDVQQKCIRPSKSNDASYFCQSLKWFQLFQAKAIQGGISKYNYIWQNKQKNYLNQYILFTLFIKIWQ